MLYRAHLVEAGAIEDVVAAPQHPYTRLLIAAIPRAETTRHWLQAAEEARREDVAADAAGCCFADRCPVAAPACLAAPPGLYRTAPHRAVACVQYREHPELPADALGDVLPRGLRRSDETGATR